MRMASNTGLANITLMTIQLGQTLETDGLNPMKTNYLLSLSKTELVEKMEALKVDINVADEKYQQALARGDFDTCGKYSNERAQYRRTFAKCLKFKMKRKWL